jgi:putative flippase GtrA
MRSNMKHKIISAKQKLAPHKDKFMYLGVGILAFIVDAGMFTVGRKLGASIGIANIMGMVSGMITSFSLNWQVVFKNKKYRANFIT